MSGDLLERLTKAESLTRGPLYSLTVEARQEIERLRNAGNGLERELMKLHRNHHGDKCETCKALLDWWNATGR